MDISSNSTSATEAGAAPLQDRRVWDLPLRAFHWLVVVLVGASWATAELGPDWFTWHQRSGYAVLVLVAFRIGWGFVGPRHARFGSFLAGPRRVLDYARKLADRSASTTAGHNPLGGWAVLAMLVALLAQGVTGLFANDDVFNTGPLYGYVSDEVSDRLRGLHEGNFEWMLVLIGLHLAAIVFYAAWKRIDLVRAMWTGRKPARFVAPGEEIDGDRLWLALALLALAAAALWYVVDSAPVAEMSYF
ncbi:MAG: cytochrome b/b6 domain-containing protein [Gammaproteobacteria bacterium]|nr:cytochrome b/b6 domain-containing protein [Gammaproteobacteria bacterium]